MTFTNRVYNVLKFVALVLLPGIATLYGALAAVWHFGYITEVVTSISAVDTFLGGMLHISSSSYTPPDPPLAGHIVVNPEEGKVSIEPHAEEGKPVMLEEGKTMAFKVVATPPPPASPMPGPHGG